MVNNIKSYFTSFQTALQKITDSQFGIASLDLFMQNLAISSNSSIVTATATTEAARQTYDVLVEKLATSTKATSGYIKRETLNADLDTTLGDLGARTGNITVNSQSFNIKESDTIKDLIKKFSDVGVIASFDEKQSKFTISCAINELDDSTTNLKTALKLQNTTILGASSGSIVYATKDTELYKLGLTAGKVKIEGVEHTISKSGNNYTISKSGGSSATINTVGQFLNYLKGTQVKAESAEIDDNGNISIRGAVIESVAGGSNLMDALKLGEVKERTVMESNNLTYQQYHAADLTTKLKTIGITGNKTLIIDGTSSTIADTTTLQSIKTTLAGKGVDMDIDENGVITIDTNGAVISGTLIDALGLDVTKGGTTLSSSPHTVTYQAYGDTLLSELGVTNTMTYTAHRSDGTAITGSINNNAGLTVDGFIARLKGQGLDASFDETTHQITIKDGYIDGTLATQLGMSSVTDYYQEYAVGSTTLEKLGATGNQTLSIDGGTAKTYAKTATLQSVINDIVAAGGTVTLKDGTITVADVTLTGTIPALLGFEAVTTGTTVTSGALTVITNNSSTSSAALDENKFYNITMSSKLGDITGSTNSYTLTVNGTSSNLTKDSTLQSVANAVTAKGGTFTINDDNTVTVDGVTLGGTLVTALGLATVGRGTEMTSNNPITTGGDTEIVTGANTLAQLGSTGNTALSITNIATGTTTTKNYTTATTVDTVLSDIRAAGGTATIEDGVIKISGQDKITLSGTALDAIHVSSTGSYSQITGNITYNAGYSTQTGALTPTLTRPLTLDTKLSDINGLSTYQLITPAETKNFNSTDTLNTVKQYLISKGGNLEVDDEGKVTIEFTGNLTGSIATALKLAVTDQNTSMTSTNAITMNQSFLIDSDTTFGGTGTNSFNLAATARTYALYDTYGNVILAPSTSGTDGDTNKVSNWLSAINTAMNTYYGTTGKTYAKVENGVISIDGGYVSGDLPNAIGMTSSSTVSGKQLTGGVAQYTQESKFIGQVSNQIIPAGAQRASAVSSFSSGSIYLVSDASDLKKINTLASQTTGVTFILTNDIDLSSASSFTGIDGFKGTFLGNGYEIKNFSTTGAGFFKSVTGATIKDLGLVNINYTGTTDNKGGLVGSGSVTIDNCYVSGGTIAGSAKVAGGLAGNVNGTITNSYASVNITANSSSGDSKGGLVGKMTSGSISNSYASGDVNCSDGTTKLGGFAGSISNTTVTNCYATGNVYINTTSNSVNIGGFVGNGTSSNITNSYSTGNASTSSGNGNIGSFAGSPTGITFNTCIYNNEVGPASGGTNSSTTGIQGWSHSAILADGNSLPKLTGNNPYIYREILSNTTLAQIGLTTTSDRQISITVDGNNYTNTFASNATVQDVVNYLNGIDGIRATFENSQLNVQSLTSQNIDMGGKVTTALGGTGLTQSFVYAT
ncbi:MAG: GLUG motif-containing protein, partial [Candidatus Gastranaerophilaceae bacterium]